MTFLYFLFLSAPYRCLFRETLGSLELLECLAITALLVVLVYPVARARPALPVSLESWESLACQDLPAWTVTSVYRVFLDFHRQVNDINLLKVKATCAIDFIFRSSW